MYTVIKYGNFKKVKVSDKQIIEYILLKYDGIYMSKDIKDGYNISFNGVKNEKDAVSIKFLLDQLEGNYDYNKANFHRLYSGINDPNYTGKSIQNKVIITVDPLERYFENMDQYKLYQYISNKMDLVFFKFYFNNIGNKKAAILNFTLNQYKKNIEESFFEDLLNSHISHLWAFFSSVSYSEKKDFISKLNVENLNKNYIIGKESKIFMEILERTEQMLGEKKINYYSPYDYKKISNYQNFASEEHKYTFFNQEVQNAIFYNKYKIANRWFLNILYKKMLLMNLKLLDRYQVNYALSKMSNKLDIDGSFKLFLSTGEVKLCG